VPLAEGDNVDGGRGDDGLVFFVRPWFRESSR
jgi:hypothetical protein